MRGSSALRGYGSKWRTARKEFLRSNPLQTLTDTNEWTDLGSYYRKGGKIIFYHGASDPWYSMFDTLD